MNKGISISLVVILVAIVAVVTSIFLFRRGELPPPVENELPPLIENELPPPVTPIENEIPPSKLDDKEVTEEGLESVVKANNRFALEFYTELRNREGEKNIFFSPYSLSTAFSMVYEGAAGKTADEIRSVFHLPKDDRLRRASIAAIYNRLNREDVKYKLHTANALWVQKNYQLLKEFTETLERYYGARATNVDFKDAPEEAREMINKWVEDKTNDKIKGLFPQGSIDPLMRLVLTNAVYFKGNWLIQFDKNLTEEEDFIVSEDKKVKVPMMRIKDVNFNYAETEKLQILEMLYDGEDLSMLVLLPKDNNLKSLEESLTIENLNQWKTKLKKERVNVYIPKFTFDSKYSLNDPLKAMGMLLAFIPGEADLSGIDGTKNLFIQIGIHRAFVDVNEEGTEAAAVTGIGIGITHLPQITVFRADRPFIFLIQQRKTGNILFMGALINPKS